jgi:hypothetical protein
MLMKSPTVRPTTTYARTGNTTVRLATGIACPHCSRELKASDVEVFVTDSDEYFGNNVEVTQLICTRCHNDVLLIQSIRAHHDEVF